MFRITAALRSVCDITPTMLQHFGIRGLLLDLDNTPTTPVRRKACWIGLQS